MTSNHSKYWLNWTIACGTGEFLGIGVAAGIAFVQFAFLGEPVNLGGKVILLLLIALAGIIEGSVTGYFQWSVLKKKLTNIKARNWLGFTALGAAIGWLLGMTPSVIFSSQASTPSTNIEFSDLQIAMLAILGGVVLGALFGAFQWIELRKHALNASRWILANLLGWAVGFTIIYLGASNISAENGLAFMILIGTISGLVAGLLVGTITGLFLIKLKVKE